MSLKEYVHVTKRYGDSLIILGIWQSKIWTYLGQAIFNRNVRFWHFFFALIKAGAELTLEIFSFHWRAIARKKAGAFGTGIIITLLSFWNMLIWNTESCLSCYSTFISEAFVLLYTIVFTSSFSHLDIDEILNSLRPQSKFLTYYIYVYVASSIINLISYYAGFRDKKNKWSKGTSIIFTLLKGYFKVSRQYCHVFFEPAFLILAAYFVHHQYGDFRFALFIYISAGTLFFQEIADYMVRKIAEK